MPRPSKRTQLLTAAATIVRRDGSDALTLDAVASEAGVSKGGLLYHFDSKEALIAAMVALLVDDIDAALPQPADTAAAGSFTRAYLGATADTDPASLALSAGLLAAVAIAPDTLAPLRDRYRTWNERFRADGIDPIDAMIVRLAADGLWLADLLGLEPPTHDLRPAVLERLAAMTRRPAATP